ncbi:hypothetical protein U9M48_040584 [Paspalum notatum var. saurae]|uniref:Cysteine-rich PDZ-binding protein n=1 Tax=Paspalum notatum var. saurae TaxID=547442 RepID=A0AAQ3XDX8_PASNO
MVCAKCKTPLPPPTDPDVPPPRDFFPITLCPRGPVPGSVFILVSVLSLTRVSGIRDSGEKKLGKVIVPDKWKEGASNTNESGGRKINENKLLSKKNRWTPYGNTKCIICKQQVHQDAKYCHTCAYSKGVCAMCGKQVLDTKLYKQSNV